MTESLPAVGWPQAVDAADLSLLPGLFRALEQDFGVDPKGLATLVLSQSILKGLAYRALSPAVHCPFGDVRGD